VLIFLVRNKKYFRNSSYQLRRVVTSVNVPKFRLRWLLS